MSTSDVMHPQAKEYELTLGPTSMFQYRGKGHRTVCQAMVPERTVQAIAKRNKTWEKVNGKRNSTKRTTADKPLWYVYVHIVLWFLHAHRLSHNL